MSQKKVDKYKEEKANRQQIMKKQKMNRILHAIIAIVIAVGLVGWFSVSLVRSQLAKREPVPTVIDGTSIDGFMADLESKISAEQ